MPPRFLLFQRDDCHLCDLALEALAAARAPDFGSVFIDGDEALEARYGTRVPVFRDAATGRELDWPFHPASLAAFLATP
jgi:hypothetical protein